MDDPLADLVRRERLRRNWSVRTAATRGGISNTFWAGFEDYRQPLTPTIVEAVAKAYLWSRNWPVELTSDPAEPAGVPWADLPRIVEAHGVQIAELRDHVEDLIRPILERVEALEDEISRGGSRARRDR